MICSAAEEEGYMKINDIKNVTIAGCGTQGSQIASQVAYKGFNVTVWVRSEASIERAKGRLAPIKEQYISTLTAMKTDKAAYCRGLADSADISAAEIDELLKLADERLGAIRFETDYDKAFGDADVVIECIAENPPEKKAFYQEVSKHLPERTMLLTDSSTFLPSTFAEDTGRPDKYLTLHFANQIWKNNMTELMKQSKTDEAYFALAEEFAKAIGMIPLKLNKEWPGYILNSLLIPWFKAACTLCANGVADPETVDMTWQLATGSDPGQTPFRKLDKIGLGLAYHIFGMDPKSKEPGTNEEKIVTWLKGYIDAGKTGIAAGEGFYKYENYDK